MKKTLTRGGAIAIALAVAATLFGCAPGGDAADPNETMFERAQRTGTITIGFANAKPYAYTDDNGELAGEAVEVGRAVLAQYGITKIEGVLTEFDALLPGLVAGRYDAVMAGQYINATRAEQVDFTNPEYTAGPALAVKKGNPEDLNSYEDVLQSGAIIAAVGGSSELAYLQALNFPEAQIAVVPDFTAGLAALAADRVSATTMQSVTLVGLLKADGASADIEQVADFEIPVIDGKPVNGYGASYVKKGVNQDFIDAFNEGLAQIKESGELLEILLANGFGPEAYPGDITAQEVLDR